MKKQRSSNQSLEVRHPDNVWGVLNKLDRREFIKNVETLLVIFSANWCRPCKEFKKSKLPKMAEEFPDVGFLVNDIDIDPAEEDDEISSVPTAVLYVNGQKRKIYRILFDQEEEIKSDLFELMHGI